MRQRIVKLISFGALSVISCNVFAVAPGFYMGMMLGPATNNGGTQQAQVNATTTTPATPKSTQFGTRIFMGNKIGNYFAFEGGLTYFSNVNYDTKGVQTCSGTTARVRDFDFVGKGIFPVAHAFDIFGKAGAALVYQTTSGGLNPISSGTTGQCGQTQYQNNIRPTVSVGASYDINQNWVADLSWNRIMVGGVLSSVDLYALGISYHFVDIYCGQFLC